MTAFLEAETGKIVHVIEEPGGGLLICDSTVGADPAMLRDHPPVPQPISPEEVHAKICAKLLQEVPAYGA